MAPSAAMHSHHLGARGTGGLLDLSGIPPQQQHLPRQGLRLPPPHPPALRVARAADEPDPRVRGPVAQPPPHRGPRVRGHRHLRLQAGGQDGDAGVHARHAGPDVGRAGGGGGAQPAADLGARGRGGGAGGGDVEPRGRRGGPGERGDEEVSSLACVFLAGRAGAGCRYGGPAHS
ncbi:uncharacterized protein E0L32_009433 [Thyridium curvatum]|uniref:Uncharacterized protein n=1 Tax=Thyridium curvatum TaxID=1093900 RepID=A0A507AWL7_9PEZI|nr:uncharacterized protein E0L32_009433 [Thyridium curvatum]TPX09389.1 hypothetical protein E0L32_009433 [Thyridium curvatum]